MGQATGYNLTMTPEHYRMAAAADLAIGGLTRMPPAPMWWVSPVGLRIAQDGIEWLPRESHARGGVIVPSPGLLDDFVTLTNATTAAVLDFARTHGVLGLGTDWTRPREFAREPLQTWLEAARQARDLLVAAQRLRQGQLLTDDERVPVLRAAWPDAQPLQFTERALFLDGEPVYEPYTNPDDAIRDALLLHANGTLDDDRVQLTWAVTTWMMDAGAQLVLTWPPGASEPALTIGGERPRGCLPAITVQVALACSRAESTRSCDGCGALHTPRRQPKPGNRSFCEECRRRGVPVKLANRDGRARERAQRTVAKEG